MTFQKAPFPDELADLVDKLTYKPGWEFTLDEVDRGQGSVGLTLDITITCLNSYDHTQTRRVAHYMPVPPAAYTRRDWQRWLLDQVLLVESHEACEFFTVDGAKPYAPNHGPGRNPYTIVEQSTPEEAATSFRGDINL